MEESLLRTAVDHSCWYCVARHEREREASRATNARAVSRTFSTYGTGWYGLNDGNLFPGQSPRRFFESDHEILRTSSMSPYEETRPNVFCFLFLHDFSSAIIWEIWTKFGLPLTKYMQRKKVRHGVRPRDMDIENTCANFQGPSLKNGVDTLTFVWKTCEICVVAFNYLVSVYQVASTLGDKYYFILTLRSQIFEHLRETFCRRALGYLEQAA